MISIRILPCTRVTLPTYVCVRTAAGALGSPPPAIPQQETEAENVEPPSLAPAPSTAPAQEAPAVIAAALAEAITKEGAFPSLDRISLKGNPASDEAKKALQEAHCVLISRPFAEESLLLT